MDREILDTLASRGNLRRLVGARGAGRTVTVDGREYVNLSSNDYLGLTAMTGLQEEFLRSVDPGEFVMSNPSSRLVTGNSAHYDLLEHTVERLFGHSRALVLGSGYAANSGVLPAITSKEDLILADKLVHASIIDGLKLSAAQWARFNHNDTGHLESLLKKAAGKHRSVWVATESLFSMDGDFAPLEDIVALKERYGFGICLDEAHAFGVCGPGGKGYAAAKGLDGSIDILMATLGKALASCGAFVLTDAVMREVLVNRMRPLIFSTALPPVNLMWSAFVVERLPEMEHRREHLAGLVRELGGGSHIIPVMAGSSHRAQEMAQALRDEGFWAAAIRTPTVPECLERVRLSLGAALTTEDVVRLKACLKLM